MSENIKNENTIEATETAKTVSKFRPRKQTGYPVDDELLLYKLSDAGLLGNLHGVNTINGNRVFFFDKTPDVRAVISESENEYIFGIKDLYKRVEDLTQKVDALSATACKLQ